MATENGTATHEPSTSKGPVDGAEERNGVEKGKPGEKPSSIPFHKLFSFADSTDVLLMVIGTVGAVGNGVSMPLMTILFGQLINSFGQNSQDDVVGIVSKVHLVEPDRVNTTELCVIFPRSELIGLCFKFVGMSQVHLPGSRDRRRRISP